jgi:prolyl oligopeptidase PreP (S9A serine peptidase family)
MICLLILVATYVASGQNDKYQWLEDVNGKRSIEWVREHNKRAERELQGDERFKHARKFAALMEEMGKPFYFLEILEGGHSSGADIKQQASTSATILNYLTKKLMDNDH